MKIHELTIKEISQSLRKREFSSEDLTRACLDVISEKNPTYNAFITVSDESALSHAKAVDKLFGKKQELHALAGIPFSVKDSICTQGIRSTAGAKILDNYIPPYTATTVQRILDKHGIILGKNNCDAFGHGGSNENSSYGPAKNPYDTTKVAGGSSGGSGVAVALHMGVYSIGEDTGGSVRCPAAFCGVYALKVSYGRNSRYGAMPMASSLDSVGPIAKSVYDLAVIEEVMAGVDSFDSTSSKANVPNYLDSLEKDIAGLRAGVPKEYFDEGLSPQVREKVEHAIALLEKMGVEIQEVSLPMTKYAIATYYIIVPSEDSSNLARIDGIRFGVRQSGKNLFDTYAQSREQGLPDEVKRRILIGTYALSSGYYDAYYLKAQKVRTKIIEDFKNVFEKVDFLITPTQPTTAFGIGEKSNSPLAMYLADAFVIPASVAGIPAVSLPCGRDDGGLPVGAQIIAPYLREDLALNVAYQLDQQIKK